MLNIKAPGTRTDGLKSHGSKAKRELVGFSETQRHHLLLEMHFLSFTAEFYMMCWAIIDDMTASHGQLLLFFLGF